MRRDPHPHPHTLTLTLTPSPSPSPLFFSVCLTPKKQCYFSFVRSSSIEIIENSIIVFIDDIGQIESMNTTYIYAKKKRHVKEKMEHLLFQLNDLPDEILMTIFKKLYNPEVLYSLIGVNKRLNRIAHDPIFTGYLSLLQCCSDNLTYPLPDPMLDRFCSKILPEIGHQIKSLYLESTSMKRILLATNYPNLYDLGLCGIDVEVAISLFIGKRFFFDFLKN